MKHIIAFVIVAVTLLPASAQESAADWVAKLGSRNFAERQQAVRMLAQMGKAALPALRVAMRNIDLETKRRALALIGQIEDRLVAEEVLVATPMRFQFKDTPVADAVRSVEAQTGIRCGDARNPGRLTVDTGAVPFWQAWRRLCEAAELAESDFSQSAAALKVMRADDVDHLLKTLRGGAFEMRPRYAAPRLEFGGKSMAAGFAVDERHSVRTRVRCLPIDRTIDPKVPHAVFAVEVRGEPRLNIVSVPRVDLTKIVEADGQVRPDVQTARVFPASILAESEPFVSSYVGEIQYGGLLHLKAIPWPHPLRTLRELHGRVHVEVSARPRLFEIPNVIKAGGKEARGYDGVALKVLEAEWSDSGDLHVRLHLDDLESLTPRTLQQQIVRVRPGVIAVRGVMDVALDRLELRSLAGRVYRHVKGSYEPIKGGKGYEANLVYEVPPRPTEEWAPVMTQEERTIPVEILFVVRDVVVP